MIPHEIFHVQYSVTFSPLHFMLYRGKSITFETVSVVYTKSKKQIISFHILYVHCFTNIHNIHTCTLEWVNLFYFSTNKKKLENWKIKIVPIVHELYCIAQAAYTKNTEFSSFDYSPGFHSQTGGYLKNNKF